MAICSTQAFLARVEALPPVSKPGQNQQQGRLKAVTAEPHLHALLSLQPSQSYPAGGYDGLCMRDASSLQT